MPKIFRYSPPSASPSRTSIIDKSSTGNYFISITIWELVSLTSCVLPVIVMTSLCSFILDENQRLHDQVKPAPRMAVISLNAQRDPRLIRRSRRLGQRLISRPRTSLRTFRPKAVRCKTNEQGHGLVDLAAVEALW